MAKPTVFRPHKIHPEQLTGEWDILPRCSHGSCLVDGGGERLVPPCGCRACHYCHNLADEHIGQRNSCPDHYADALEAASRDNAEVTWTDHRLRKQHTPLMPQGDK
jgi:hypothetical protein